MSGRPPVLAHERFVQHAATLRKLGLRDRFAYVFRQNMWGASDSRSGLARPRSVTSRSSLALGIWRIADIPLPAVHAGNIPE